MRTRLVLLLVGALVVPVWSQTPAGPPVLRAMQEELARSMAGLKLEGQPQPYYIGYSVTDAADDGYRATAGAIVEHRRVRSRVSRVDVRVGDYAFDSSRFLSPGLSGGADIGLLPVDDDETVMRRQLWLSSDQAYKRATQLFARKQAAFQNRTETDQIPDFSRETPAQIVEAPAVFTPLPMAWADLARQASEPLTVPEVVTADVMLIATTATRYFANSEGFRTVVATPSVIFRAGVTVLADDGMTLRDAVTVAARRIEDLPAPADLVARTRRMLDGLRALRASPIGEDYSGPVLVEGEAAAALVTQYLAPLFLSQRAPDSEDARVGQATLASLNPFLTRIGSRVLPDAFLVRDTPSLAAFEGRPVGGAYTVDDEGVRAQDVTLVQDGRLLTLLTSRTPQRNLLQSNGHGRDGTVQPGVLQVSSASALSSADVKAAYLKTLATQGRPFGYIIRRLVPGIGRQGASITAAVKVTPDGREEPVRGLVLGAVTHTAFRDIIGASRERTLSTTRTGGAGTLVSVIVPDLLFEDLDIQKSKDPITRRPLVPSPIK